MRTDAQKAAQSAAAKQAGVSADTGMIVQPICDAYDTNKSMFVLN